MGHAAGESERAELTCRRLLRRDTGALCFAYRECADGLSVGGRVPATRDEKERDGQRYKPTPELQRRILDGISCPIFIDQLQVYAVLD